MDITKRILITSINTDNGWSKCENLRYIRLGNEINCNDETLENSHIKKSLIEIMDNFKISKYNIQNISNKYEFSYELTINEIEYQNLKEKLNECSKLVI